MLAPSSGVGRSGGQLAWRIGILDFAKGNPYLSIYSYLFDWSRGTAPFLGIDTRNSASSSATFWSVACRIFISAILTWSLFSPEKRY